MARPQRIGGSFAPPIDATKVAEYRKLVDPMTEVGDVMDRLCSMMEKFLAGAPSSLPGTPHPSGRGIITPLEEDEIKRLFSLVPWPSEVKAWMDLFDAIPLDSPLRNSAMHLLWYGAELSMDRVPITNDKL